MWRLDPQQRLSATEEFQERVTQAGGVNKYDDPNFRFVWGMSQDAAIRAGGVWENPEIPMIEHYCGYRDVLVDGGEACWLLQQWMPAEFWGAPAEWYANNFDPSCEMQILGEYPYKGRYVTILPLVYHEGGTTEHMPLNSFLVDAVIPIIIEAQQITTLQKRAVIEERKARRKEQEVAEIEGSLRNAFPALGEIRSAAGLSCLSVVQKKVEAIEKHWQEAAALISKQGKGLSVIH